MAAHFRPAHRRDLRADNFETLKLLFDLEPRLAEARTAMMAKVMEATAFTLGKGTDAVVTAR